MKKTTHNGIILIIYTLEEVKKINLFEKHKKHSVSYISQKYDRLPHHVKQWMDEGRCLYNL